MQVKLDTIKGIGPQTLNILRKHNIWSAYDLVSYVPKGYEDYTITTMKEAKHQDSITVIGKIVSELKIVRGSKAQRLVFKARVFDEVLDIIIFGRSYLVKQIQKDDEVQIKGDYHLYQRKIIAKSVVKAEKRVEIKPIYGIEGLHDKTLMNVIETIKEEKLVTIYENIPTTFLERYQLVSKEDAYFMLHLPENLDMIAKAKRRMKYEEAFFLQLKIQSKLRNNTKRQPKTYDIVRVKDLIQHIPYTLTDDQKQAVNDIYRDFKKDQTSYRLIQGDVGSGKTIVALLAAYAIVTAGEQVAIMAPTELLAYQHFQFFHSYLKDVKIALLTSKTKQKNVMKSAIENHQYDIVIGTHALIERDVKFSQLGLVIIDEQHKFGVQTREELIQKTAYKDVIYLTATPIPRTLALLAYGESHVSTIKEKPKERIAIETKYITRDLIQEVYNAMHSALIRKEHCMVVVPAIDSDTYNDNINHMYQELKTEFPYPIFILHGKMSHEERDEAMENYVKTPGSIMLATTMIEVGIDIPTATIMTIMHADSFGLSQLHQLRGRVGRSHLPSFCYLVSEKEDIERLEILSKTSDGFKLSHYDLKMRGPGDFLGIEQSGYFAFKYLDLSEDEHILYEALKNVNELMDRSDFYTNPQFKYLVKHITSST